MSHPSDTAGLADLADVNAFVMHAAVLDIIHAVERRHHTKRGDLLGLGFEVAAHVLQNFDAGKNKHSDRAKGLCAHFRKSLEHAVIRDRGWNPPKGVHICEYDHGVKSGKADFMSRAEKDREQDDALGLTTEHAHPLAAADRIPDDFDPDLLTPAQREAWEICCMDSKELADAGGVTRRCAQQWIKRITGEAATDLAASLREAAAVAAWLRRPRQISFDFDGAAS